MKNVFNFILISVVTNIMFGQGFKTRGADLLDANGNVFIMKGFNAPLTWFQNDVNNNIANMKTTSGANTIRLVVGSGTTPRQGTGSNWSTPDNVWQTAVQRCIDNKIIPMVEIHNVLGSNDSLDIRAVTDWWISKAAYLNRPEISRYVLINIANEWGDWFMSSPNHNPPQTYWRDTYIAAVKRLRAAGIKTTIVIDAPGYGQDNQGTTLLNHAQSVINADPEKNLLFSVHAYCEWKTNGPSNPSTLFPSFRQNNIPFVVGEFASSHPDGNSTCEIDEVQIMNLSVQHNSGYLGWSWKGNSSGLESLDIAVNWNGSQLTTWGNTLINGTNGTKTALEASVFNSSTVNVLPSVTITAPANNSSFTAPASISINATATDTDGSITKVEFFNGTSKLGEDVSSPYSFVWSNVAVGTYSITVKATDNSGGVTTSGARSVSVTSTNNGGGNNTGGTPISATFTGTPASCVITYPFSNAYFQTGSVVPIRVYASDQGGSSTAGSVTRVEVFNGDTFLGTVTSGTNNTFIYNFNCVQTGTFILRARAVDNSGNVSASAGVKVVVGAAAPVATGLSANKGKYFANIIAGSVPQNYNTYWNGVTAENDCKWGSVERSRDVMTWTGADRSFNHAKNNNLMFRYHALAWGNQYPCWAITGQGCSGTGGSNTGTPTLQISEADFQAEVDEYMAAVAARYGDDIDQLDVLNENLQFGNGGEHAPATAVFRQALGGYGASGYDWVIWLFTRARRYFPNSKLIL